MEQKAGTKQLRSFGLVVGGVFTLLGVWPVVRYGEGPRLWAVVPGVLLVGAALLHPPVLKHPHAAWMTLGRALGWINTRIILAVVFYGIFTPVGVMRRWMGKDSMRREFDPQLETYRQVRSPRPGSHMRRQF